MIVYIVRCAKYWNVLEVCETQAIAENYIKDHGRETEWIWQKRTVLSSPPAVECAELSGR